MTARSGGARLAGVMGWPVAHSRSPALHEHWLARHGIDGAYVPLAVEPEYLREALAALPILGFRGVNLTIPHKEKAVAFMDRLSRQARRIGAINTVVVDTNGCLEGSSTDGHGFIENLRAGHPGWQPGDGAAVLLGAGGAARAIAAALVDAGVPELRICNRTAERGETLARDIGGPIRVVAWAERAAALANALLLVNATALGMNGAPPLEVDLAKLLPAALVTDIVYVPLETPLLKAARLRGNPTVDGLGMLLHQARPSFAAWFGVMPEVTMELRTAVLGGTMP
jgi:shikimate dehydrogenase